MPKPRPIANAGRWFSERDRVGTAVVRLCCALAHTFDGFVSQAPTLLSPGRILPNDIALGRAGLFVLPTHSENFGVAVAEALAAGTAVVVSKGAPWSGVVRQNSGWWHEIGPDGLEEALDQAMALPLTDLHAYGNAGRAWMERDFNWDAIGTRVRAVYEWQLGNGPKPTCVV